MKKSLNLAGIIVFFISQTLVAQNLQKWSVSSKSLNFGSVLVNQNSNQGFWIYNHDQSEILKAVISLSDTFVKTTSNYANIPPMDSVFIQLTFKAVYNIRYNSLIVVSVNRLPGSIAITATGDGKYAEAYYNSTFNLWDEELKTELKKITGQGYVSLGYNTARDYMYGTIDNKLGWVTCAYTGRKAQFATRSDATANNFNCEHTWPQSMFSSNEPMKSDIHHLYSTDETANGKRDNDPFGVVTSPTWSVGGSKSAGGVFEPRDEQKGNAARSIFYMAMRYQNYTGFLNGQEAILRTWNKQFPPDQTAIDRNNAIFGYQKNRNPFVDHPDYLDRILSLSSTSTRPLIYNYWYAGISTALSPWPVIKRNLKDTLEVIVYNKGTGAININTITPPVNGKLVSSYTSQLNPGNYTTIKFSEEGVIAMGKTYEVKTDKGSYTDSLHFEIQSTGSVSFNGLQALSWYPIPSYNGLFYLNSNTTSVKVKVCNAQGQIVLFTELRSELNEIDLTSMPNGIYFVETLQANHRNWQKLVLQK